jgi:dimethylhistidine N-methyltransferase
MSKLAPALHSIADRVVAPGFRLIQRLRLDPTAERHALIAGLLAASAAISPKYLYDALGCSLFEAICELPEYYPTRTERAIFNAYHDDIVRAIGTRRQFVDLGAGDCAKAALLLPAIDARRYIAVDIAAPALAPALARLVPAFPEVEMIGVVTDFSGQLDLGGVLDSGPATFFFPGSSIGNFTPDDALSLLGQIRRLCARGGGLLIGVDTKKDASRLHAAYNDALGVTAAFNRNVLSHVNAVIDADFDAAAFTHVAFYNAAEARIEMHLEARSRQHVRIAGQLRDFSEGERIHTEYSHKYAPEEFAALLRRAGFEEQKLWQDPAGDFAVFHAQ